MRAARRERRGASAIEFALTLPVFLVCALGAFDLVWLVYQDDLQALALREACRVTALGDPAGDLQSDLETGVEASFASLGLGACPSCTITATLGGAAPERRLTCTVERTVKPFTGYFLGDLTLASTVSVWLERQRP